ncbi:hypothetical protein [Halovivax asiaticus]|nr:hypothetical protein [Halovivax asiaticus]
MTDPRCPTCAVEMEPTTVTTDGAGTLYVKTKRDGGILKRLGLGDYATLDSFCCPECGLVRQYADLDD